MRRHGFRWLQRIACALPLISIPAPAFAVRTGTGHDDAGRTQPRAPSLDPTSIGGTNAIVVCVHPCTGGKADSALRVQFVLCDDDLKLRRLTRDEQAQVQHGYDVVLDHAAPPNACYVVQHVAGNADAPVPARGFTRWRRFPSDSLRVDLSHGSDGGYFLQLAIHGDTVTGTATDGP